MSTSGSGEGKDAEAGEGAVDGEWVTPAMSYIDPVRRFCALCGRPIARRYWKTEQDTEELAFCDPAHAARYATYPERA